jgi:hypothetical protein
MTIGSIEPELLLPPPRLVRRRVRLDSNDWWQRISAILTLGAIWALLGSNYSAALDRSSPRAFPLLFTSGLMVIATALILGYQYGWPRVQRRLFRAGIPVRGQITGLSTFSRRGSTNYYIHYEFTTEAGRLIRTKMVARKADFGRARAGLPATVLYAAGFPRHNLLYDYADFTCRRV